MFPLYLGLWQGFSALLGSGVPVALENTSPSAGRRMASVMCYIVIDRFPGRLVSAYIPCLKLLLPEECYTIMNVSQREAG